MTYSKYIKFSLIALTIGVLSDGCKKGEEDPAISFQSRKKRMEGKWEFDKFISDTKTTYTELSTVVNRLEEVDSLGGISIQTTTSDPSESITVNATGDVQQFTINFTKSNRFEMVKSYSVKSTVSKVLDTLSAAYTTRQIIKTENVAITTIGNWNFLDKIKNEYKNKERVALNYNVVTTVLNYTIDTVITITNKTVTPNTVTITTSRATQTNTILDKYADGERVAAWNLVRLSAKEILIERPINNAYSNNYKEVVNIDVDGIPVGSGSAQSNSSVTVVGLESMRLNLVGEAEVVEE